MSEVDAVLNQDTTTEAPDELTLLKDRARKLNLTFSPNIGLEALRKKIAEKLSGTGDEASATDTTDEEAADAVELSPAQLRRKIRAEGLKLVRLRVANMNPSKADLHGEFFTVANRYLGNFTKFVPFGEATDEGYHVPFCIYEMMKARKFLQVKTKPDQKNPAKIHIVKRWLPEFSLEVLDPLTPEELKRLANQQAAAAGMSE